MDTARAVPEEPRICPFLRWVSEGVQAAPVRWPDEANRCTALGDAAPQSLRQQEYACLASAHVNCPRFVRGVHLMVEPSRTGGRSGMPLTPAIIGALVVLAASFALSVAFVVANGGMDLPVGPSATPLAAAASETASPAASPSAPPIASVEPSASASIEAATATPSQPAVSTPPPSPTPAPSPSSDRYALLKPCPDASDCWIYTVRTGDNLVSIARYFGVPFDAVTERNPWTRTTPLVAGQELRLPPPTR